MLKASLIATTLVAAALFSSAQAKAHQAAVTDNGENSRIAIVQKGSACGSFVTVHVDGRDVHLQVDVQCPVNDDATRRLAEARLKRRAAAAVLSYYALHAVTDGAVSLDLKALYAPTLDRAGMTVSRDDHLVELAAFDEHYESLDFDVIADSLDLSGCTTAARCVVHGTVASTAIGMASGQTRRTQAGFALVFDLRGRPNVIGECSMTTAAANHARGCASYPFQ